MTASGEAQYVTFAIDKETFAVPVTLVREILDYEAPFRIPNGPDYLLGLTEVRGRGVPTVDLRRRLGLEPVQPTENTRILVLDVEIQNRPLSLGMVTDRVFEVAPFRAEDIEPAPDIGARWRSDYIAGVVRRAGSFVLLIDLSRLFEDAGDELVVSAEKAA